MTRILQVAISIVIAFLILSPIITTDWLVNGTVELEKNSSISNAFIEGLLDDPFFDAQPDVVVNGTSLEFSSNYHSSSDSSDVNYIEMKWTHTENTELDFRDLDPENILPDYNDFIYTYQEFEFPYETFPVAAQVSLNYSVFLTGDFAPGVQEGNNLMFRVYVWVIDSSGNWIKIYETRNVNYTEEYTQEHIDLNYFNLIDIFRGMVENEGVQQDPTDSATLAIGLAPRYLFESYLATEPWTFYDGSVSLRVSYADMYVIMDIPDDSSPSWQPNYNVTYGTTIGHAFPQHENASDEVLDECVGMKVGPDGSVYVSGNTRSSYEWSLQGIYFRNQFLLKYDPSLNLLKEVKNENRTQVRSMYSEGGYIYTTGYIDRDDTGRNLIVTKWSSDLELIWQTEWSREYSQVGVAIGVQSNGSIYVVCSDYDMESIGYDRTLILKFDDTGDLLWNRTSQHIWTLYGGQSGDLHMFDDFFEFYIRTGFGFGGRYYFNGTEGYGTSGAALVMDGEGGCYVATYSGALLMDVAGTEIILAHYTSDALHSAYRIPDWHVSYSMVWPNGWGYSLVPRDMIITPDDKIQLLIQHTRISNEYLLLTYDLDGNLLENRTIGDSHWPWFQAPIFMASGNSGLVYFAFTSYGSTLPSYDVCIQAYEVYDSGGFPLTVATVIIIASTVVIMGAVVGIVRAKRRDLSANPLRQKAEVVTYITKF